MLCVPKHVPSRAPFLLQKFAKLDNKVYGSNTSGKAVARGPNTTDSTNHLGIVPCSPEANRYDIMTINTTQLCVHIESVSSRFKGVQGDDRTPSPFETIPNPEARLGAGCEAELCVSYSRIPQIPIHLNFQIILSFSPSDLSSRVRCVLIDEDCLRFETAS